jgi:hypothetical protein
VCVYVSVFKKRKKKSIIIMCVLLQGLYVCMPVRSCESRSHTLMDAARRRGSGGDGRSAHSNPTASSRTTCNKTRHLDLPIFSPSEHIILHFFKLKK